MFTKFLREFVLFQIRIKSFAANRLYVLKGKNAADAFRGFYFCYYYFFDAMNLFYLPPSQSNSNQLINRKYYAHLMENKKK